MTAVAEERELFAPMSNVEPGTAGPAIQYLVLDAIAADPHQPRQDVDDDLAASIAQEGVLQPITVRRNRSGGDAILFVIVDGERRWRGALKTALTTIPAIITEDADDEAKRLVRQSISNTGKPLPPLDEAKAWKRIQELTGKNVAELAKILGRPKSTVSDRLAIADAPTAFQPLFANGTLTAAAAPIVRKFADVPPAILQKALKDAQDDWDWKDSIIDNGGVLAVNDVERILDDAILENALMELPVDVLGEYKGPTVDVKGKVYATDPGQANKFIAKYREKNPQPAAPRPKAEPRREPSAQEKKWATQQRHEKEQRERVKLAIPALLEAIAGAIRKASTATCLSHLVDVIAEGVGGQWMSEKEKKQLNALVPRGSTLPDAIKHLAFWALHEDATNEYHLLRTLPKKLKPLGLDVKKVVDAAMPPKPEVKKPAKKKTGKTKGKM